MTNLSEVSCTKILFKSIHHDYRKKTMAGLGFCLLRGYIRLIGQCESQGPAVTLDCTKGVQSTLKRQIKMHINSSLLSLTVFESKKKLDVLAG